MQLINRLRREQGIGLKGAWDEVIEIADPAVEGVGLLCQKKGIPVPEVGYELQDREGRVVGEVELAWPDRRVAVVISDKDKTIAAAQEWSVWKMIDVLDNPEKFAALFGR